MISAPATKNRHAASLGLPHPPYLLRVIRRSAGLWLLVRCGYVVVLAVAASSSDLLTPAEAVASGLQPNVVTRAVLVAVAAFLVWWDRKRAGELLLHANLGARPVWFWAAAILTASVLDIVVQTLVAAF